MKEESASEFSLRQGGDTVKAYCTGVVSREVGSILVVQQSLHSVSKLIRGVSSQL